MKVSLNFVENACEPLQLRPHSHADTMLALFGTVANVSCDLGYRSNNNKTKVTLICINETWMSDDTLLNCESKLFYR